MPFAQAYFCATLYFARYFELLLKFVLEGKFGRKSPCSHFCSLSQAKFFPMSMASSFTVRCCLYPLTLIRTRLQIQYQSNE